MTVSRETITESTPLDMIAGAVSQATGIRITQMKGRQQSKPVVEARKLVAEMAHALGLSASEIGRYLNKNHATILDYVRKDYERDYNAVLRLKEQLTVDAGFGE